LIFLHPLHCTRHRWAPGRRLCCFFGHTPHKNLSDCTLRPTSLHWCNARTRSG
jgi:hypothetical protein